MSRRSINPWWTVVAGVLGSAVGAGTIMVYAYGILSVGMGDEFGWDRATLGLNMTAFLIGSGLGTVTLGWLISRFGIQAPSAILASIFGLSFAAVAILPQNPFLCHALFLLAGIGGAACTAMPYAVAISGYFDARRGLALGIVVAGSGIGSAFWPQMARYLVDTVGWRGGFSVMGLAAGLVAVGGLVLLVRTPEGVVESRSPAFKSAEHMSIQRLFLQNRQFWMIALPILGVSLATFGGMASLVPMFRDQRFDPATIAAILSVAGLTSLLGRLIVGYLLDKIFAPFLCAAIFGLAAAGFTILVTTDTAPPAYAGAALVAAAMGAEADLVTFLVSRYFRLVDFSRVVGVMWVVWAWGGGVGTGLAGQIYKLAGTYHPAFLFFAALLVIGGLMICFLGPYRNPVKRDSDADRAEMGNEGSMARVTVSGSA